MMMNRLFHAAKANDESEVRNLIEAGADVNITDKIWGRTPLFYAVLGNFKNVVHALIDVGANVNVKDKEGNTCLFFAVLDDKLDIVYALIDAKADVNEVDRFQERTPIFYAVSNEDDKVVDVLIAAGADVNVNDRDKRAALSYVVINNTTSSQRILQALTTSNTDVNKSDFDGRTALFIAVENDNQSLVQALIDAGADVNKADNTALFLAVQINNQSIVQALIEAGADVNKADQTALFIAVQNNNQSIVQTLIDAGVDVNIVDLYGRTALFIAVENDNQSIVQALIDAGADVNKTYYHGRTALFNAVQNNNQSIVQALIDAGADVKKADQTSLFNAVQNNNQSIVQALIDAGVDVNIIDLYGRTALFFAVENDNQSIVQALIDAGVDVNKFDLYGRTALFIAKENDNQSIVQALIDAGVDVNKTYYHGRTALFIAVENDNQSIVQALIDAGADVNKTAFDGQTALFIAVQNNNQSIVQALIDAGADVNKADDDGKTALFIAVENDNQIIVQALIDAGADVNIIDLYGRAALFIAVENDNQIIVQALIDAGADVNKDDDDGKTALFNTFTNDNQSIVQALIEAGADVNKVDDDGQTALFIAVENDSQSIVQALIEAGADVNKVDDDGKTALFNTFTNDNQSIVQALIEAGALINFKNHYGRTPLCYTLPESPTSAHLLLDNGANPLLRDNCNVSFLSFIIENILFKPYWNLAFYSGSTESTLNQQLELLFEKGIKKESLINKLIEVLFCKILLTCTSLGKNILHLPYLLHEKVLPELLSIVDEIDGQTKMAIERVLEETSRGQLLQVVPTFIDVGADPNSADQHGNTFLHYVTLLPFEGVSQEVILEICHQLRQFGATMNIRNQEGQTPLLFCLSTFNWHFERSCKSDRIKALVEICRFLLNHGLNSVNDTLPNGETIFHLVIQLFQKGLQLQDEAFRQVVLHELLNLLQLFLGAHTKKGNKGFHLNMLIHLWASLTLPPSKDFSSDVTYNCTFKQLLEAILQILLKCGARVNARDDDERTPLHLCKTWSAVKLLIDNGANTDDVDSSRHPPLFLAAEKYMFLQKLNCFYPDVSEDPKTFWRTAIKMNLDPWSVDQQGGSVLSIMIEKQAFVLAKALIEVTCEDKHIESDKIAYSLLNAICKDQSTQSHWKAILVEIILNSRQRNTLTNLHEPLQFCCKNLIKFDLFIECSDNSSDENLNYHSNYGLCTPKTRKRKFLDDMETKYNNYQPSLKKAKTDGLFSKEEARRTEDTNEDRAPYDSVHCEIANLLLSNGANIHISDSSGKSCHELAKTYPKLQDLLTKPIDTDKISVLIPWNAVSKKYKNRLAKVSVGQEKQIVKSFWYHKDPIGKGSFGHVFSGINEKDGREVAIKRIEKLRMIRPEDKREIKNLVILADCEQVVNYLSFLEDEHFSYVVLELMEGDLEQYFNEGPVDRSKNTLLCKDVLKGLKYLHEQNIIHRDLKPGNILYKIHPRLCLKIADFGLSHHCKNTPSSTVCGRAIVGTRCWIAPEVLSSESGEIFSEKSDTFSCGLLLHYILSEQKHPFRPSHQSAILEIEINMVNGEMVGWDTRISPEATDLLKKMLRTDGEERPSPNDSLAHPFFWTKSKRKDFLVAVGNQPEFEFWPSKRSFPETDLEKDLSSSTVFETIVKGESWDDPKNRLMPEFYHEMAKRRNYDTRSIVDLVRLIRNGYAHVSGSILKRPIIRMLLTNFAYLDYFPDLVIEVFKAVTNHGWDRSRPEIKHVINKEE